MNHPQLTGTELFELDETGPEITLRGWVVASVEGVGCAVSYEIVADRKWVTRRATTNLDSAAERSLEIEHDGHGTWSVNGEIRTDLSGCLDIDLGITPSTNTLPIRRLEIDVGATQRLNAAWVRFPDLSVDVLTQSYERLGRTLYRYSSDSFQRDLEVDGLGVVLRYGDDLWEVVSR